MKGCVGLVAAVFLAGCSPGAPAADTPGAVAGRADAGHDGGSADGEVVARDGGPTDAASPDAVLEGDGGADASTPSGCEIQPPVFTRAEVTWPERMPIADAQGRFSSVGLRLEVGAVEVPSACCPATIDYAWQVEFESSEGMPFAQVHESFYNQESPAGGGLADDPGSPTAQVALGHHGELPVGVSIISVVTRRPTHACFGMEAEELQSAPLRLVLAGRVP